MWSVTAFGKLWRTTAFRITLINLGVFVLFAIMAFGYFGWNARRIINNEIASTIDAEIKGLSEQYEQGGIRRLASAVEQRASQPGASLYLVTDFTGRRVAGNISALAPGVLDRPGSYETNYQATDEADRPRGRALVRVFVLQSGFRVVVGRDILERERLIRRRGAPSPGP